MTGLVFWALLAGTPVDSTRVTPGPVRGAVAWVAGPRGAPDSSTHDVGHFTSTLVLAPAVALWLKEAGVPRGRARWLTAGTMVAVVVLKEVYDHRAVGNFSGRDLAVGAVGAGVGMVLAERVVRPPSP